ncbi:MAG: class I SAM-dependent methyltransferase [Planctomycetota bacterium]|nr:class I SAM-dependent methyltransferase [Planctomycetota bacterium]
MDANRLDLAARLAPRDPEHARVAQEIYDSREDLRGHFPSVTSFGYREWLAVHGRREYADQLAGFYPPVPPDDLRATVSCGEEVGNYLKSGIEDFRTFLELYEVLSGKSAADLSNVLDFGCGCGRLLHWFEVALPEAKRVGIDVSQKGIEWLQANMQGEFHVGETQPPSVLADNSIDLVVSVSVWSHLPRSSNLAWIGEMARVCRPGGIVILTTHGAFALASLMRSSDLRAVLEMTVEDGEDYLRRLEREHFLFERAPEGLFRRAEGVESEYGQAFFDAAFVREHWSEHFELLACVPVAHVFLQDVYVLRARS